MNEENPPLSDKGTKYGVLVKRFISKDRVFFADIDIREFIKRLEESKFCATCGEKENPKIGICKCGRNIWVVEILTVRQNAGKELCE